MDVLLIQPPIRDFYLTAKRTVPYGLACIAASLEHSGFSVGILDALATDKSRLLSLPPEMAYLENFYGRPDISPFCLFHGYRHFGFSFQYIEKQIRESGAFLVGVSALFTAYAKEAEITVGIVKKALPGVAVVVGGHHPTALPEDVMKWESVDFAIRGEGEAALPYLAEAVKGEGNISSVPGIVYRESDGSLHISEPAFMENPDTYPLADRRLIKNAFYTRGRRPSTVVVTSRGCPLHCSYCSLGNRNLYPYRQRSVMSVLSEMEDAVENFGARFIDFEDENLSFSKKWFLALLKEIRRRFGERRLELRAMNGLYPPSLDQELVAAMKAAGFKSMNLSLGATSGDQLERFQRPDVLKSFEDCLAMAESLSLDAVGYVICGAPGQKPWQSLEDLLYLARQRVLAGLSVFYPAPGSRDYETAGRMGILPADTSLFRSSAIPLSHTTSRLQSVTLLRLSRIVNFMKALIDRNRPIPSPARITGRAVSPDLDRFEIGCLLLGGFLHDGRVRGVLPDGNLYDHLVDRKLVQRFRERLAENSVSGTISRRFE